MANRNNPRRPLLEKCSRTDMWCNSRLDVRKVCFVWKIDNFSLRPEKIGDSLKSITFSEAEDSKIKWSLRVYPKGLKEKDKDFVSLFMYLEASDRKEIWAKYNLALLNDNEVQEYKYCESNLLFNLLAKVY